MSLVTQISNVITAIGTEFKSVYAKIGDLTSLTTTAKSNLVAAVNELAASIGGAGATINDSSPSTTSVYSSSKTEAVATAKAAAIINDAAASTSTAYSASKTDGQISAAVSALVNSSPAALDTLKELADALGDDADFATTMTTALGNRLRVDAAQGLTSGQKTQGQSNLDVYSKADIGDPTTDFAAVFTAALA